MRRKTGSFKVIGPLGTTSNRFRLLTERQRSAEAYSILKEAWQRACVPYERSTPDGLVLHDARHMATTPLLETNISPKTVQEWMGWSDKAFVLYYSHATKESREQAGKAWEQLAGERTAERVR